MQALLLGQTNQAGKARTKQLKCCYGRWCLWLNDSNNYIIHIIIKYFTLHSVFVKTCNCCKRELAELSDQKKQHDIDDVEVHRFKVLPSSSLIASFWVLAALAMSPEPICASSFFSPALCLSSSPTWFGAFGHVWILFWSGSAMWRWKTLSEDSPVNTSVGHALQGLCERQKLMRLWQKKSVSYT